jgi:dipeptidyl aminopeptidase/acylaminoacyl peptidase
MNFNVRSTMILGAAVLQALLASRGALAQTADSLSISAALSQPSFPVYVPVSMSPDGHAVAYTVCAADRANDDTLIGGYTRTGVTGAALGCEVWVADVHRNAAARLNGKPGVNAWAPQWSPDGTKVAYYCDATGVARLWIWDVTTRMSHPVSDAIVRPYTTLEVPRWTPDSRGVVTRILPYGTALAATRGSQHLSGMSWDTVGRVPGSTATLYRTDSSWRNQPRLIPSTVSLTEAFYVGDLALIQVVTGKVNVLARGYKPFAYWVSPEGHFVAFTSMHGITSGTATIAEYKDDLVVVPINDHVAPSPRLIADRAMISPYGTGVAWSPRGSTFAYATAEPDGTESYNILRTGDWSIHHYPVPDSISRRLGTRGLAQPLRWDPSGQRLLIASDSTVVQINVDSNTFHVVARSPHNISIVSFVGSGTGSAAWEDASRGWVVVSRNDSTKRMGFARIDARTGVWTQVTDEEQYMGSRQFSVSDISADGQTLVYATEGPANPQDLWIADTSLVRPRRLTNLAPSMAGKPFGKTRLVHWTAVTGELVSGALLLPSDYTPGHRYPLIVYPYPLDHRSNNVFHFGLQGTGTENMQLFSTRGFAVLVPDAPIRVSDQMRSLADVIVPGVDQIISMGIADSARIGVIGHSWGGYTVLALLVQTHRFKTAVMRGGYGDLFADYGEMQDAGSTFGQLRLESWLGTTPWKDLQRYIDNSPVFFLDRVVTPLLIVEGGAETTVPPHEAAEIFVDLRRLGKEVQYALYGGENHGESGWRFANQQDYLARIIQWFQNDLADARAHE